MTVVHLISGFVLHYGTIHVSFVSVQHFLVSLHLFTRKKRLRQQAVPAVLCYYYMDVQVSSPRVFISPPSCSASDLLSLKLLEFLHCDVPVSLTLAK